MPGKDKGPDLPAAPVFEAQPNVAPNIDFLSETGLGLARGEFLREEGPLSFLRPLATINPEVTEQAVSLATRDVTRLRDRAQQDILNQLEANNQLTSSVAVNRLSDLNEEFSADIADIATTFYLADVERSLRNIGGLFELGLNVTGQATGLGLTEQAQRNEFALQNFENQVAAAVAAEGSSQGGGLLGGGIGTALGAGIGAFLAAPTGGLSIGAGAAIGGGLGGAVGSAAGGTISPARGQVDPGLGFIGGGLSLAGAGAGLFRPTSILSDSDDFGLSSRLRLIEERLGLGEA